MKKTILLLMLAVTGCIFVNAQSISPSVVSSGGGNFQGSSSTLDWTVGETITETAVGGSSILTQGYHQSSYTIVSIPDTEHSDIQVSVFPNPTDDFITIKTDGEALYSVCLVDNTGKLVYQESEMKNSVRIDLRAYATSNLILTVNKKNSKEFKSFRIIKRK